MGIQLGRPRFPSGTAYAFPGRSPFLGEDHSHILLPAVHTVVVPKAKWVVPVAEGLQTSKELGTDTEAVESALALKRVAGSQLIRSLLQPIVCWAFQGTIGSRAID
jgi:hypothetical protein